VPGTRFSPSPSRILVVFGFFALALTLAGCPQAFNYHPQDPNPDNERFVSPTPTPVPPPPKKRIFVSSVDTYDGSWANPAAADGSCQALADTVPLGGGPWKALISFTGGGQTVNARILDVGPWYLVDNTTKVFDRKIGAQPSIDTWPLNPINMDENGVSPIADDAWTGTTGSSLVAAAETCTNWTGATTGRTGRTDNFTNVLWISDTNDSCGIAPGNRIYCIEQ